MHSGDFTMTRSQWLVTGTNNDGNSVEVHHRGMQVHRLGAYSSEGNPCVIIALILFSLPGRP
jgi:hypothetical protein